MIGGHYFGSSYFANGPQTAAVVVVPPPPPAGGGVTRHKINRWIFPPHHPINGRMDVVQRPAVATARGNIQVSGTGRAARGAQTRSAGIGEVQLIRDNERIGRSVVVGVGSVSMSRGQISAVGHSDGSCPKAIACSRGRIEDEVELLHLLSFIE